MYDTRTPKFTRSSKCTLSPSRSSNESYKKMYFISIHESSPMQEPTFSSNCSQLINTRLLALADWMTNVQSMVDALRRRVARLAPTKSSVVRRVSLLEALIIRRHTVFLTNKRVTYNMYKYQPRVRVCQLLSWDNQKLFVCSTCRQLWRKVTCVNLVQVIVLINLQNC